MLWSIAGGLLILVLGILIFWRPSWKSYRADEPSGFFKYKNRWSWICDSWNSYDCFAIDFRVKI